MELIPSLFAALRGLQRRPGYEPQTQPQGFFNDPRSFQLLGHRPGVSSQRDAIPEALIAYG